MRTTGAVWTSPGRTMRETRSPGCRAASSAEVRRGGMSEPSLGAHTLSPRPVTSFQPATSAGPFGMTRSVICARDPHAHTPADVLTGVRVHLIGYAHGSDTDRDQWPPGVLRIAQSLGRCLIDIHGPVTAVVFVPLRARRHHSAPCSRLRRYP